MLDVFAHRRINISACCFIIPECSRFIQCIRIVKIRFARHQRPTVTNIFIDVINSKQSEVLLTKKAAILYSLFISLLLDIFQVAQYPFSGR